MKAIRILLQLVILGTGGVALAALVSQPNPDITSILVFLGFLAFLLALTLVLKEHTENRLVPEHELRSRPISIVLLLAGAFCIFNGTNYLLAGQALPNGTGSCRAVCGLILLASELFGEATASVVAFSLWSSMGLFLCFLGYQVWRDGSKT